MKLQLTSTLMDKYAIWLIGTLMLASQAVTSQAYAQSQNNTTTDTIPFELTSHNNIAIKAILNKADTVNLMFHTAADGVTLIKKVTPHLKHVQWTMGDKVKSWGGAQEARFSENNSLQIGKFQWDSISIWENENSGPETDGKFGPNLFKDKVVEVDFDNSILIIYPSLPHKTTTYHKIALIFEDDFMFIEAISSVGGRDYPNRFLIHSGYGGTVLYDDKFVEDSKIGAQIEITDMQELKDSYGNVLKTKKGKLPKFSIGDEVFYAIPVGFFEGAIGRQKMSVIGGNLLKRFNFIIDANRETIFIKPSQLKNFPY